jgi:hypothetical protein
VTASTARDNERNFHTFVTIATAIVILVGLARAYYFRVAFPDRQELAAQEGIFQVPGALCTL